MFSSNGHLIFDPYISYKCQRLASTASERESTKYHRKTGFFMINPTKRGCQSDSGQGNHSISNYLHFEVKEAVKVIEAVEVIIVDGVNETTEVIRFT